MDGILNHLSLLLTSFLIVTCAYMTFKNTKMRNYWLYFWYLSWKAGNYGNHYKMKKNPCPASVGFSNLCIFCYNVLEIEVEFNIFLNLVIDLKVSYLCLHMLNFVFHVFVVFQMWHDIKITREVLFLLSELNSWLCRSSFKTTPTERKLNTLFH